MNPAPSVVDVHAHFLTPGYVDAARQAGHQLPDGMPAWPSWSARDHLELMDRDGIARSLLSISSPGVHFGDDRQARELARRTNEYGAQVVRENPGRFGLFAALPLPDVEGALAELDHALGALRADGVAIETNAAGAYLGDPRWEQLWQELDRRGTVVFVHPTSPPDWRSVALGRPRPMIEFLFDSARTVTDLIFGGVFVRHPRIRFVFTHTGGVLPMLVDRIELFRRTFSPQGPDGLPSAGEQLRGLWFDTAGTPVPQQLPALTAVVGTERVLYGSDYCFTPPAAVAAQLASLDADGTALGPDWRALTTANAERLLDPATVGGN
jgi:6-methylsalicylate decarboxylase